MILLIPEINILNYFLCLFLSINNTVKAYRRYRFLPMFKGRIELLVLSDYFDWSECAAIGSQAVDIWEAILLRFASSGWKLKIKGSEIDLLLKAKQQLQHEVEKLLFLKKAVNFHAKKNEDARIINSLKFDFLSRSAPGHDLFRFPALKALSEIFIFLDRINLAAENLLRSGACVLRLMPAFLRNQNPKRTVRYLCAGIAPSELSDDKSKLTFSWLVDGVKIRRDEVVFLLPGQDMLKLALRRHIISYFPQFLWFFAGCAAPLRWGLQRLLLTKYAIRIMQWAPAIETLKPKIYIDSISSAGFEDPGILYLKQAKGIKTVMWSYGINSPPFSSDRAPGRLRRMLLSHIICSEFLVWNEHYREFIEGHAQNGLRTHALGPLMCGDEDVMHIDRSALFEKIGAAHNRKFKYVAIFDSPPVSHEGAGFSAVRPGINSEKYNYEFMRDMVKLLSDFEEIILVYKPKRALNSKKFSYAGGLKDLLGQIVQGERAIALAHDINPWFAVAIADICISIPFISAPAAAIHYGKIGIFHDPANIVLAHRYDEFGEIITHSYEELKSKMAQCLYVKSHIGGILDEARLRKIQGRFPGENSSRRFREYLESV